MVVNRDMKKITVICFIILILLCTVEYSFTDDVVDTVITIPRELMIFFITQGDLKEEEKALLKQTLAMKLSEDEDINIVEPIIEKSLSHEDQNKYCLENNADSWLNAKIAGKPDKIIITYSSYDLSENKFIIREKTFEKARELRNIHRLFWKNILIDIARGYSRKKGKLEIKEVIKYKVREKDEIEKKGVEIIIAAKPGTQIKGLGEDSVLIGEDGMIKKELIQRTTYKLKAECPGYYTVEHSFYVGSDPVTIELDQTPASSFGFDAHFQQFDYFGAGFFYFILPDRLYTELSFTTYILKLIWPVQGNLDDWQAPVTHLLLTAGYYFGSGEDIFRFGLSSGFFLRFITFAENTVFGFDPLSGWGLKLIGFHAEASAWTKIRFFYEHNFLLYLTDNTQLVKAAAIGSDYSDNFLAGYIFLDGAVLDTLDFRIGIRILL